MKKWIKNQLNKLPHIRTLYQENILWKRYSAVPPGHFYSPIVNVSEIKEKENKIWDEQILSIDGINLAVEEQLSLLKQFSNYYDELSFKDNKTNGFRYYFENPLYSYTDAIVLYSFIRHYKPKKIIELGSGFTSALMLDVNELFFENRIFLKFIEPYPNRLFSLMKPGDNDDDKLIIKNAQDIDLELFKSLEKGDILFVDSTHIVKTGSDVNYILFSILPVLKKGVLIHFHDIFFPFEYPKKWVYGGHNWNETYFLRSFLMYNNNFKIKLFSHFIHTFHKDAFKDMPLSYKNVGGNIWIEKV